MLCRRHHRLKTHHGWQLRAHPDGSCDWTSPTGARYHPLSPARILDTRTSTGPIGQGSVLNMAVAGQGGIPSSGVGAVMMNVTVTGPTSYSLLTLFPTGEAMPVASNMNFLAGETVANLVTAKLGAGGQVSIYNGLGATQVVVDVAGWFDAG